MPHVAEHKEEFIPLDFSGEQDTGFIPLDFGIGQGRTEQQYVPDNNSVVNVPVGSSAPLSLRESKELIEGQEGFFGNTSITDLFGAPGGIFEAEDIKKLPGGIIDALVQTVTGGLRERVILGAEKRPATPADLANIQSLITDASIDLSIGNFRSGVSKLFDALGTIRQVAPPGVITGSSFDSVVNLVIQKNPDLAQQFNEKMLQLQAANEDFLIRNGLMFGPDDEPTVVGNLLSQLGLTGIAIGGAILLKNPAVPALIFGVTQQVSGFQEAEEAGKDPFTAAVIGDIQGIIEGGISFLELGQLVKIVNSKSISISKKIVAGMVAEGIEEGVTEALIASVQNLTGVADMTLREALITVFQAIFYGSLAGGGVTGSIATVQRMVGGTQENVEKIARVMDVEVINAAVEVTEQATADIGVELEIGRDGASDQPVTKAAKTTGIQQKRVIEIMQAVNEGKEIDIPALMDEIFPETRIQREKKRLEQARTGRAITRTKQAVRERVIELQTEIQIAEQQGNEEEAARLSEEIDRIQQISFGSASLREAVEELEAEGVFVRGSELLDRAVAEIDDVLRPLRAGVRVGRVLQKEETTALQDSLTQIVRRLGKDTETQKAVIDAKTEVRLQRKIREVNTIKNAESIRRDILSLARKSAFRKFISERRLAIDKLIEKNVKKPVGKLDADSQNALDSLNKMKLGMESATRVKKEKKVSKPPDEIFIGVKGVKTTASDALDASDPIDLADAISQVRRKIESVRLKTGEQNEALLSKLKKKEGELAELGFDTGGFQEGDIIDLESAPFDIIESIIDDTLPEGVDVIDRINKPAIRKDGEFIRRGQIAIRTGTGKGVESVVAPETALPLKKERTPEQEQEAKRTAETRQQQVTDFNIKQSKRIQKDMGQGIPSEGVILQVRYLDILNEKAKATPNMLALFEDDLNAFIETGKGIATLADSTDQEIVNAAKTQMRLNPVKTFRADITNKTIIAWDQVFSYATTTFQTLVDALQLSGTPFDFFNAEVAFREERLERQLEVATLRDEVSEGDGKKYRKELESDDLVIDIPLEGHSKQFDGTKSKRIRMTRGQLITAWMYLREPSLRKQMIDPNGDMAWTDDFIAMVEQRMTRQDVAFAEGMFEIYSRSYDRFNEVYRRIHNRDLTRVEFYTHVAREGKEGIDASTHNETMFIDLIAPKDRGGSEIFPQEPREAKERVESASSEIKIGNVLVMYDKYIWDVEHFISHGEQIRLADTLLKDKEFKRDLEDILTPGGFLNFKAHMKITSRTNVGSTKTSELWQQFESLRQKAFKSTLGLNEKIGLGQTATMMSWAPRMPKGDFAFGIQDYMLNPAKANAILNKHSTFRNRELNFDSEFEQLDAVGTIFKFTTLSIRKGDGLAVRAGAWADVLSSMKRKGLSEEEALNDAARFAEASQQSTLPSQRSLAQKTDDPLVRTMMMYRSSLVAMFNVSMQSVIEYRQVDISTPEKKSAARKKLYETIVTQNIIIPGLYATLTGRPLTTTILIGSSQAIPFLSDLLEVIIGVVMNIYAEEDERVYFGGPLSVPAGEAFTEVEIAINNMGNFIDDVIRNGLADAMSEVTMGTFIESIQGIIDVTTGFPMTNAMNKYEAVMKLFDTDDPIDAALQMIGFKEEARERTIDRLDALPGVDIDSDSDSDRILTQGAF